MNLRTNLERITLCSLYKDNWNKNGAKAFSKELIERSKNLIQYVVIQPKVFPTARDSFHFEYTNCSGDYLKFELYEDDKLTKFIVRKDGTLDFGKNGIETTNSVDNINEILKEFFKNDRIRKGKI